MQIIDLTTAISAGSEPVCTDGYLFLRAFVQAASPLDVMRGRTNSYQPQPSPRFRTLDETRTLPPSERRFSRIPTKSLRSAGAIALTY